MFLVSIKLSQVSHSGAKKAGKLSGSQSTALLRLMEYLIQEKQTVDDVIKSKTLQWGQELGLVVTLTVQE